MNNLNKTEKIIIIGVAVIFTFTYGASRKEIVPLFLFSGQSNMVGLGATASTADQKKTVENIKIDCVSDNNVKK